MQKETLKTCKDGNNILYTKSWVLNVKRFKSSKKEFTNFQENLFLVIQTVCVWERERDFNPD